MSRLERIVAACGGVVLDGGRRALIPGPDHHPHDRSVSLIEDENGRIIIHCFSPRDDWRVVQAALAAKGLLDSTALGGGRANDAPPRAAPAPAPGDDAKRVARAQRLWTESRALAHTLGEIYLRARGVSPSVWNDAALRFHPRMTSLDDRQRRPALMASLRDGEGGVVGVQATLLSPSGRAKAAIATPRRVVGRLMGAAVQLHEVDEELVIGEGVETMLSASEALFMPVWAALSTANLARFTPPPQIKRLVIARDNGAAGVHAAELLRKRLAPRLRVEIAVPPQVYDDWNDWARADPTSSAVVKDQDGTPRGSAETSQGD